MRKFIGWVVSVVVFLGLVTPAYALKGAEYEKMVAYKKAQREKREAEAKMPQVDKPKGFWRKEAERSGFAGTSAMFGNAITSLVPLDKPNSRKPKE